jgi:hypothetical protein
MIKIIKVKPLNEVKKCLALPVIAAVGAAACISGIIILVKALKK